MMRGIPLGLHQLWHQKLRMLAATLGITFAVVLIFMQLEFREALYSSAVRYHTSLDYDLAMLSPKTDFLLVSKQFSRNRLYQVLGFEEVESVTPVYLGMAVWRHPVEPQRSRSIFVLGFDPVDDGFGRLITPENHRQLQIPYQVIFDRLSREEYGPVAELVTERGEIRTEINDREFSVVDLYAVGTSFGLDGGIITSDLNFRRIFPNRPESTIDLGLIRLKPGFAAEQVKDAILAELPGDTRVLTPSEFAQLEIDHWESTTPIGYVFTFGVIMGLVVGAIIVYQILYSDVQEHMKEYATLLAMGYHHRYLRGVVLQEAIVLATLGFLPGMAIAIMLYRVSADATQLPLAMTAVEAASVFGLTLAMCVFSGSFALRRLRAVDPAEVF
jgi:putative ABC transport system permease protein